MTHEKNGAENASESVRYQGRHTACLGVCRCERALDARDVFDGVSGLKVPGGDSRSTRRMNCKACRGDPGEEDCTDRGLVPFGVDRAKEGMWGSFGSGVRGGSGGLRATGSSS